MQVGNIGGREFAESLAPDVQKLLVSQYFVVAIQYPNSLTDVGFLFFSPPLHFVESDIKQL